ncbi:hypothetical protein AAVH_19532 [Aphelenchoides avenae]|nr:hypothetical protein AAVH_19532 [Aphelenchus avenae]
MSSLPLESILEWMAFLNRETVDSCFLLSRKLYAASMKMTALRFVDTAVLREYETVQNYNVTIAWTTVGRSRRGKPKTETKALKINCENAHEAIRLFAAALQFCVVKERLEVNIRTLLLHPADIDQLREIKEHRLADANITIDEVQFARAEDYHAASAFLSTVDIQYCYFTASALSMDLLEWADANDMYDARPSIDMDKQALTEEMILYRCFGGRSAKRFIAYLTDPLVSPQFLRKFVKARRAALTRREVRLELWRSRLDLEQLHEEERPTVKYCGSSTEFTFADIEDFKLEFRDFIVPTITCIAN